MVACAYAGKFQSEVNKVVLMDAIIPGVEPEWTQITTTSWWFSFQAQPNSERSIQGNERNYLTNFWPGVAFKKDAFTAAEVNEFVRAYSVPGALRGSFEWFRAFPKDVVDNKTLFATKLTVPILTMGAQYFSGNFLAKDAKTIANDVSDYPILNSGHWIVQENTAATLQGLIAFLDQ